MVSALIKVKVTKVYPAFAHNIQRIAYSLGRTPSCVDSVNSVKGGPEIFFLVTNIFHKGPYRSPSRRNWTHCLSRGGGSVPVFLKKHSIL